MGRDALEERKQWHHLKEQIRALEVELWELEKEMRKSSLHEWLDDYYA